MKRKLFQQIVVNGDSHVNSSVYFDVGIIEF